MSQINLMLEYATYCKDSCFQTISTVLPKEEITIKIFFKMTEVDYVSRTYAKMQPEVQFWGKFADCAKWANLRNLEIFIPT